MACSTEIDWCPIEIFQRMLDVNTLGVVRVTKAFLPLLKESQEGRIVIMASMAGQDNGAALNSGDFHVIERNFLK